MRFKILCISAKQGMRGLESPGNLSRQCMRGFKSPGISAGRGVQTGKNTWYLRKTTYARILDVGDEKDTVGARQHGDTRLTTHRLKYLTLDDFDILSFLTRC